MMKNIIYKGSFDSAKLVYHLIITLRVSLISWINSLTYVPISSSFWLFEVLLYSSLIRKLDPIDQTCCKQIIQPLFQLI